MSEIKLLPCPFCGGEAKFATSSRHWIECTKCGAQTEYTGYEEAIAIWNTRKPMQEIVEQLEANIESSDKYIREYDDSEVQRAYNKGMRDCLKTVKEVGGMND